MPTDRQRVRDLENLCGCAAADLSWLVGFARGIDSERDPAYLEPLQRRIDQLLHAAAGKPIDGKVIAPWPQDTPASSHEASGADSPPVMNAEELAERLGGKIGGRIFKADGGRDCWECAGCKAIGFGDDENYASIGLYRHRIQYHDGPI